MPTSITNPGAPLSQGLPDTLPTAWPDDRSLDRLVAEALRALGTPEEAAIATPSALSGGPGATPAPWIPAGTGLSGSGAPALGVTAWSAVAGRPDAAPSSVIPTGLDRGAAGAV